MHLGKRMLRHTGLNGDKEPHKAMKVGARNAWWEAGPEPEGTRGKWAQLKLDVAVGQAMLVLRPGFQGKLEEQYPPTEGRFSGAPVSCMALPPTRTMGVCLCLSRD